MKENLKFVKQNNLVILSAKLGNIFVCFYSNIYDTIRSFTKRQASGTSSNNERQREVQRVTTNDNECKQMERSSTTNDNE